MVEAMEIQTGFKQTEVGVIPSDWKVKKLSEIGESIIGLTYSPANVKSHGTLVLRSSNVQNGKLAFKNNVFVEMDLPKRVIVKENDILICVRNGSRQLIGKCALIDKKTAGSAFGAFMSVYRSEFSVFAFYQFQSFFIQKQINETLGATINQITNKDLARFQIPFPPTKTEQTAIATALNDADALITQLEKLIAKKRAIKQGAMQELLKPKDGWDIIPVSKYGEVKRGAGSQYINYVKNNGIRLIRINDFFEDDPVYVNPTKDIMRFAITENDVLFAGTGASAGASYIPKKEWIGFPHSYNAPRIRTNDNHLKDYLLHALQSEYITKQQRAWFVGAAQPFLDLNAISNLLIATPPTKGEETKIARILSDMDTEIEALEKKFEKLKMLKQGMMQNLLTGRIRLV